MGAVIGYHASHEQFSPSSLRDYVCAAEQAGFGFIHSSDHFHPWTDRQGQSGFAWSWLGATMQATRLPFSIITAPGYRYHPAVIAQAAATLAEMFPGRFSFALGSGEAINESITGLPWPEKTERNARLAECAAIIGALLRGETVTHRGRVTVIEARIYSRPDNPPLIFGAAASPQTAAFVATWADGLLTTASTPQDFKRIVSAYRDNGGRGDIHLQLALSWAANEAEALAQARDQWAGLAGGADVNWTLPRPCDFASIAKSASDDSIRAMLYLATDASACADWCRAFYAEGADALYLHNVGLNQRAFIEACGSRILPALAAA